MTHSQPNSRSRTFFGVILHLSASISGSCGIRTNRHFYAIIGSQSSCQYRILFLLTWWSHKKISPYVIIPISGCRIPSHNPWLISHWQLLLGAICSNIGTGISRPTRHIKQPIKWSSRDGSTCPFTANSTTYVLRHVMVSDRELGVRGIWVLSVCLRDP
jgi:hypothetical protein